MAGLSIKLYENEMRQLATLPVEQSGKILYALLCNELAYELPELDIAETVIFNLIKGQTERARELSEKRSQVRKSSGQTADKNGTNADKDLSNDEQTPTNANQTVNKDGTNADTNTSTLTSTSTNTNTSTITNTELPPACADGGKRVGRAENTYPPKSKKNVRKESKPEKTMFAEFVSMTDEEYASLVTKLGEQGAKRCVEILDNYKGASGKKYDSDYRAILNWVVKRYEEEQGKALGARGSHSYDLNAYEALAVNVPKTAGETKPVPAGQEDKSPSNGWESFDQLAVNRAFQPQRNEDGGT